MFVGRLGVMDSSCVEVTESSGGIQPDGTSGPWYNGIGAQARQPRGAIKRLENFQTRSHQRKMLMGEAHTMSSFIRAFQAFVDDQTKQRLNETN